MDSNIKMLVAPHNKLMSNTTKKFNYREKIYHLEKFSELCKYVYMYSKTCLKRNAIVPVFFFPFSQVSVLQRVVF